MIKRITLLAALVLTLSGCTSLSRTAEGARPADFALVFYVEQPGARNMLFVVSPDRTLRAAIGEDVRQDYYPPATATLTPAQMDELWSLMPTEEVSPATGEAPIIHHITITANGRFTRWTVKPGNHDEPLLQTLREWSGI